MVLVSAEDIAARKGLPVSSLFASRAADAAALATEYVRNLPIGSDPDRQVQARQGAIALATALYDSDTRALSPEEVFAQPPGAWGADVARLLQVGWSQRPVVA